MSLSNVIFITHYVTYEELVHNLAVFPSIFPFESCVHLEFKSADRDGTVLLCLYKVLEALQIII